MLDERTGTLLKKINEMCGGGGFKIAEEDDLLSCFPQSANVGKEELVRILSYLEEKRLIEIKYADGGEFCLCPLPEGRRYFETEREKRSEARRRRGELFFLSATGAFLGALAAGLIVFLLVLLAGGR